MLFVVTLQARNTPSRTSAAMTLLIALSFFSPASVTKAVFVAPLGKFRAAPISRSRLELSFLASPRVGGRR